jgi:hypothetical protein
VVCAYIVGGEVAIPQNFAGMKLPSLGSSTPNPHCEAIRGGESHLISLIAHSVPPALNPLIRCVPQQASAGTFVARLSIDADDRPLQIAKSRSYR